MLNDTKTEEPLYRAPEVPKVIGDGVRRLIDKEGSTVSILEIIQFLCVSKPNRASVSLVL